MNKPFIFKKNYRKDVEKTLERLRRESDQAYQKKIKYSRRKFDDLERLKRARVKELNQLKNQKIPNDYLEQYKKKFRSPKKDIKTNIAGWPIDKPVDALVYYIRALDTQYHRTLDEFIAGLTDEWHRGPRYLQLVKRKAASLVDQAVIPVDIVWEYNDALEYIDELENLIRMFSNRLTFYGSEDSLREAHGNGVEINHLYSMIENANRRRRVHWTKPGREKLAREKINKKAADEFDYSQMEIPEEFQSGYEIGLLENLEMPEYDPGEQWLMNNDPTYYDTVQFEESEGMDQSDSIKPLESEPKKFTPDQLREALHALQGVHPDKTAAELKLMLLELIKEL